MPKYSIVVPLHNEQENVTDLYDRLKAVMEMHGDTFEIVLVDDGSRDRTFNLLREIAAIDSRVTVVKLRRNFGQTSALAAGFDHSRGDYIIAMDGDLQHDPADIPLFLEKIAEGYDIVSGWRKRRIDNLWLRRIPSRCANWLMAKLSGVSIHDFGTTFKAYRREVLEQVPLYGELHRFIPALASWYGASICEVPIRNVNRERGASHYGISRTFRVFFDLITIRFLLKYLARPLHFFGTLGMMSMLGGSGVAVWLMVDKFLNHSDTMSQHGPLMIFGAVLLLAGLNMLAVGLLGEMQVRHYHEPTRRAPYSVDRLLRAQSSEEHTIPEELEIVLRFRECLFVYYVRHFSNIAAVIFLQNINQPLNAASGHAFIGIGGQARDASSAGEMGIQTATVCDRGIAQRRIRGQRFFFVNVESRAGNPFLAQGFG
jgi:glycosyltransferase involved in cell wall biosynthesis